MNSSLPGEYFDHLYAHEADPWGFTTRWYERRKYACVMAALPRQRYQRGFEPGCSIGVLTGLLAGRCDQLLATDIAEAPLVAARERLAGSPHVVVQRRSVPDDWPPGTFDLIVISELGYYLDTTALHQLWATARTTLRPGGTLLAVHWRHRVPDYPQTGDAVHKALAAVAGLARIVEHIEEDFQLEVYLRTPPPPLSVATRTGLR